MAKWKMPPKAKIYEALSAVADHRVSITGSTAAEVISSSRDKAYDVGWSEDLKEIASNDNASYWQGYMGYPIVAVLLKIGKLDFNSRAVKLLEGIPWKAVNDRFKRNYDMAVEHVLEQVEARGGERKEIIREVQKIYDRLDALGLQRGRLGRPPPKGGKVQK